MNHDEWYRATKRAIFMHAQYFNRKEVQTLFDFLETVDEKIFNAESETGKICCYCKKNPGCKPGKPHLWNGFFDKETNQHVCFECRKEHYRIKSENGTKDFNMIEFPVQIT